MVRSDALHSRLVAGLRIALPLVALGLLSMLFLLSREIDPSRALPYATVDAEDLARDPRITAPRFTSAAPDGTALTLTAATVRIAAGARETTEALDVDATLRAPDGAERWLSSNSATVDQAAGLLLLRGEVDLRDQAGHRLRSDLLEVALDRSHLVSPGPVTGTGPLGRIDAGAMVIDHPPSEAPDARPTELGSRMRFTGGVRLVHQPPAPPGTGAPP